VIAPVPCLLLTTDAGLARRVAAGAAGAEVRTAGARPELERGRELAGPAVLVLDLRHPDADAVLAEAPPEVRAVTAAFGLPDSEPFVAARQAGLVAVEPLDAGPALVRATVDRAASVLRLQEEVRGLQARLADASRQPAVEAAERDAAPDLSPLCQFARAARHFHDAPRLIERIVEGIADATGVGRVGLFARLRDAPDYRLHAGLRCLDGTAGLAFAPADPFVRWLERHAHLVCRERLPHIADPVERGLLQRALDAAGAEVIVPLPDRHGLLGWIFFGHRATGLPFTPRDLSDLAIVGEHVATLFENALLYEEIAVQKTLAENLLETIPVGIVAVSGDGAVRWFNRAAEAILGRRAAEIVNRPVEEAGSRLADLLRRALLGEPAARGVHWTDPATRRTIAADVHCVGRDGARLGAMALLADVTRERLLREKQEEVERHAFWTDLAAAMSHEVRNPLVAISTFAQLLPERYTDAEFRKQFHEIVTGEVKRLNAIIAQINDFAHPPATAFSAVAPSHLVEEAKVRAGRRLPGESAPRVEHQVEAGLPALQADEHALAEALAHVLVNAYEAVHGRPAPHVALHVRLVGGDSVAFAVSDNGPGIAEAVRDRLFSPFGTTKPRGLGLGLPLARRAVVDHGGRVDVVSSTRGTTVTLTIPLHGGRRSDGEAPDC
jgi:signal transduction histidine kinase